jgi:protein-disulfide isomerase
VRFVYRHMAFLGPESVWAAAASECASEQNRFWDYHDVLFTHTAGRDKGVFTKNNLKQYAADMGLDRQAFNACVDTGRYEDWVRAQTEFGRQRGITSTPSIIVNGQKLASAPASFEDLKATILNLAPR